MRVSIIGGGIGGLTAALSLQAAGIAATVHEAVPVLKPLGVGINLLPHAVRELTELGLADELAAIGVPPVHLVYANKFGQEIWREPRGLGAGYHWPQFSVHRGRLQMLLLAAVRQRLGEDAVKLGQRLQHLEMTANGVAAVFDGSREDADLIIAADGIHSAVRAQLYPDEGAPIWNHRILWRGVTPGAGYLDDRTMVMAGHQSQKFVCYPIRDHDGSPAVNWIAELAFPAQHPWRREDWNRPARLADFLPAFADWRFDWLDVPQMIEAAPLVLEYPMVDRDPLPRWTQGWEAGRRETGGQETGGRVTLLGDAAHPMYPIGSNGASQAILDARVLAFQLATAGDIDRALDAYESARRPATSQLVLANRANGPEQVMQLAEERAPDGFVEIDAVIPRVELEAIAANYKRLAGFDPMALNQRPSWSVR